MNQQDALLCAICERPDDDAPRLIFADWLDDHSDEQRAEFIRVQVELARLPNADERRAALMQREQQLWDAIGERLRAELPQIDGLSWEWRFERGFVSWVRAYRLKSLREHRDVFLTRAPVRGLWTGGLTPDELAGLGGPDDPPGLCRLKLDEADAELFEALADTPLCRRLIGLDLSQPTTSENQLIAVDLAVVANNPAFAGLRQLDLTNNFWDNSGAGVAELLAGSSVLTGLTDLCLQTCWLQDEDARLLAAASYLMRLERLELGNNEFGPEAVRAFTEGPYRPDLTHLSFGLCDVGDEGAAILAAWPGLSRFHRLDLGQNAISPGFVESIAREGLLAEADRLYLYEGPDGTGDVIPAFLNLRACKMTEAGVAMLLRSPHRRRLASLELASSSLETTLMVGSVPESLRAFFAGDPRVS
jgi:uncharacterized protein (TIGR02996 family)